MKQREAFSRIFAGMRADLHDYRRLRELLDAQFAAAVQHRSADIRDVGERITELATLIEQRRAEREHLAALLVPRDNRASMMAVADRLQGASRSAFDTCWHALESAVRECKTLNMRNCRLLMDQYDIMQRVLNAEADTYAPA